MSPARPTVLIGVGNRDRGDDAAGPIVCDLVAARSDLRAVALESSVVDLPLYWGEDDRVVIIDAARAGDRPGRIVEHDALASRFSAPASVSTHSIDVGGAIELARALDRLPAALTIVAIEGASFDLGAPLTEQVRRSVEAVANRFLRLDAFTVGGS